MKKKKKKDLICHLNTFSVFKMLKHTLFKKQSAIKKITKHAEMKK